MRGPHCCPNSCPTQLRVGGAAEIQGSGLGHVVLGFFGTFVLGPFKIADHITCS